MRRHLKIDCAEQTSLVSKKTALKAIAAGIFDFAYSRDSNGHLVGLELIDDRFLAKDSVLNDNKTETVVGHPINVTVIEEDGPGAVMRILPLASRYDPRWKAEVAPHLFGPNSGLISYSPKFDAVMEQSPLISGAVSRERDFVEVTDKALAAQVFAKWFAGLMCGDEMHRLVARDQAIVRLIRDNRMRITTFKPTREEVEKFFYKALNGASSLKDLPSLTDLVFTK